MISNRSFEIWDIDFVEKFPQGEKITGVKYLITTVEYVNKWVEDKPVESCTK